MTAPEDLDPSPDAALSGRCPFCAHPVSDASATCPECGRPVDQGLVFAVRKPLWVRILVYVTLAAMLAGGVIWLVDLLQHAFG